MIGVVVWNLDPFALTARLRDAFSLQPDPLRRQMHNDETPSTLERGAIHGAS